MATRIILTITNANKIQGASPILGDLLADLALMTGSHLETVNRLGQEYDIIVDAVSFLEN